MILFIVRGNHEDPAGNPLGYTRTTQKSKWIAKARKYEAWKNYVWQSLCKQIKNPPRFKAKKKVVVRCYIEYRNDRRADPGNVVKGIVDALADKKIKIDGCVAGIEQRLFPNDKYVLERAMDFTYSDHPGTLVVVSEEENK